MFEIYIVYEVLAIKYQFAHISWHIVALDAYSLDITTTKDVRKYNHYK